RHAHLRRLRAGQDRQVEDQRQEDAQAPRHGRRQRDDRDDLQARKRRADHRRRRGHGQGAAQGLRLLRGDDGPQTQEEGTAVTPPAEGAIMKTCRAFIVLTVLAVLGFAPAPLPKRERQRDDPTDVNGTWEFLLWESGGARSQSSEQTYLIEMTKEKYDFVG